MPVGFNPALDFAAIREALAAQGRYQVRDFLPAEAASRLADEIEAIEAWDLALTTRAGPISLTAEELRGLDPPRRARLNEDLRQQARRDFSFAYSRRDVVPGDDPVLTAFRDWLCDGDFLEGMRELTGDAALNRADAHATCYRVGSFLKRHDDTYAGRNRRYAYVMNLTRRWEADWGGLLHFEDDDGAVIDTLPPRFNCLSIFAVPQQHFVSQVATYALNPRYAITGWLFAD